MRNVNWKEQIYRAIALACMLYAVTIVADTARAAEVCRDCPGFSVTAGTALPGAHSR